ncbi:MAG: hypothetical protein QW667_02280 [Candidatus Bathyarchaeia archaeon]
MKRAKTNLRSFKKNKKAVSPAISTVILTSAIVVLLLVTIVFANNFLNARMAENEFSAVKQFMQTVGLQIDDVAWIPGRTQTISYASKYGSVNFESLALNYSVYINGLTFFANYSTGILLFNMPISRYSLGNNYFEGIYPINRCFLQTGTSAPVCYVYVIEKLPMDDGNFIRVVVVPIMRMLSSTISSGGTTKSYFKFYLPILSAGVNPRYSQSVTLMGKSVAVKPEDGVTSISISAVFPKSSLGFSSKFFNFNTTTIDVDVPDGSTIEFYTGEVVVSLGLYG